MGKGIIYCKIEKKNISENYFLCIHSNCHECNAAKAEVAEAEEDRKPRLSSDGLFCLPDDKKFQSFYHKIPQLRLEDHFYPKFEIKHPLVREGKTTSDALTIENALAFDSIKFQIKITRKDRKKISWYIAKNPVYFAFEFQSNFILNLPISANRGNKKGRPSRGHVQFNSFINKIPQDSNPESPQLNKTPPKKLKNDKRKPILLQL